MILQLHDVYDPNKARTLVFFSCLRSNIFLETEPLLLQINVKIKIVSGSPSGAVTAEAKRVHASWVVLDK